MVALRCPFPDNCHGFASPELSDLGRGSTGSRPTSHCRLTGGERRPVFFDPARTMPPLLERDRWSMWKGGESVLFDDSWNHEVANSGKGDRVVLVPDVLRPVPWPVSVFGRLLRRPRIPPRETWGEVLGRFGLATPTSLLRLPERLPSIRPPRPTEGLLPGSYGAPEVFSESPRRLSSARDTNLAPWAP